MSGIGKTIDREGDLLDDNFIDNLDINSDSKNHSPSKYTSRRDNKDIINHWKKLKFNKGNKKVPQIMFSGKSNEWKTWKTRYISRLVIMGIFYVLDEDLMIPDDNYEIIEDTDLNTTIEQIKNDNLFLYADIMMSIEDPELINMLSMCRTEGQKNGNSKMEWKKLNDKFEEPNMMDMLEKLKEINTNQMSPDDNPDEWITKMEGLRFELWSKHGEETFRYDKKFLKHLIMMIPSKEYGTLFWNLMTQKKKSLTLRH